MIKYKKNDMLNGEHNIETYEKTKRNKKTKVLCAMNKKNGFDSFICTENTILRKKRYVNRLTYFACHVTIQLP